MLFFYAGHGAQTEWGGSRNVGLRSELIRGVENDVITLTNKSPAREVAVILDCCFSGDIASIPGMQSDALAEEFRKGLTRSSFGGERHRSGCY